MLCNADPTACSTFFEIVAGNLVALDDRYAARDLLDVRRIMAIVVSTGAGSKLPFSTVELAAAAVGALCRLPRIKGDPREVRQKLAIYLATRSIRRARDVTWIDETVALCQ